ncbi:MarR family winged helix-turn-helix transcriptional regulator [Polaromonas sp.]|uniref:MarR family winged helix-turn-helix transcriptional regulator n=1 Tax=Polaromonas sp. TaxID=1869339 RepID=UPI003BABA66B
MHENKKIDNFGPLLVTVARRWRLELDHQLTQAGLSDATWGPLFHLSGAKAPLTQKELAACVGIDGSTLVRLLDSLEERQLVERHNDPADRRTRHIVITPAGKLLVVQIRKELQRPEAQMLEGLSPTDMAAMVKSFEKIQRNLLRLQADRSASHAH